MKTVEILSAFTGYPDGKRRDFAKGETPDLDADYADLLIGKELAAPTKPKRPTKSAKIED